jgi:hypothetical protein
MIHSAWAGRESGELVLPPSCLRVEVGDGLNIPVDTRLVAARASQIDIGADRAVSFTGANGRVLADENHFWGAQFA